MKFTANEKRLLYVLLLVVICAAFILSLQYTTKRIDARSAELAGLQDSSARVRTACQSVDNMTASIPEIESENENLLAGFTVYGGNTSIDDLITGHAVDCGLRPYNLALDNAANTPIPYYGFADTEEVAGGLFAVSHTTFSAAGTESQLHSFIDALDADDSLRIVSMSFTGSRSGTLRVIFSIDAYTWLG